MRLCSINGCKRLHHAQGVCKAHYSRTARAGGTVNEIVKKVTCKHPTRPYYALGKCKVCYYSDRRKDGLDIVSSKWPEGTVPVQIPGWGYLRAGT